MQITVEHGKIIHSDDNTKRKSDSTPDGPVEGDANEPEYLDEYIGTSERKDNKRYDSESDQDQKEGSEPAVDEVSKVNKVNKASK